jgi:ribosomal protein S18 acetylase RimI-like enzyme
MLAQTISLRTANQRDSQALLAWRNDAETIQNSISKKAVDSASHDVWFTKILSNSACLLFIGEVQGNRIGMVRFDLSSNQKGTGLRGLVNINIAPQVRGQGYGKALLATTIQKLDARVSSLEAVVLASNWQSQNLFKSLKFERIDKLKDRIIYQLLLS